MKKKLILFVVVLVAAVIIVSGCSEDALKDRVPGVKANLSMLLADNIDENVGEIETKQELDSVNFGSDLITEVEEQLGTVSSDSEELNIPDISLPGTNGTIKKTESVDFENTSLKSGLELINFKSGELVVDFGNSSGVNLLSVNDMQSNNGESINLAGETLDLSKSLEITFEVNLDEFDSDTLGLKVAFSSPVVNSVEANFTELADLGESDDFDTSIEGSTIIDSYEKFEELDSIDSKNTKLNLNFDLPRGVKMDFDSTNKIGISAEGNSESFTLTEVITSGTSIIGDSDNSATIELFSEFYNLLNDSATTAINLDGGEFILSSDGSVIIDKETKIGMKSITLSEFALNEKGIQVEPQAVETLDKEEIEDVKKGLENINLALKGITNKLEAEVSIQPYLASLPDYSGEEPANMNDVELDSLKASLYDDANKITDSINIKPNTTNVDEEIIIGHDEMDRFTDKDLFFGVIIQIPELNIENAENSNFKIAEIIAKFNIDLDVDDLE